MNNYIKSIEISDFRGFKGVKKLEFGDSNLVLFLGLNGFGKTSVFDAVEWGFTGQLGRYETTFNVSGRKQDFAKEKEILRNKDATKPNTYVKVGLSNGKTLGRQISNNGNTSDYSQGAPVAGCEFGLGSLTGEALADSLINNYFSATHLLSQETIHHFVTSKKPEERYDALSVNFGTAIFNSFDGNIQKLIASFDSKEKKIKAEVKSTEQFLKALRENEIFGIESLNELLEEANEIVRELNLTLPSEKLSKFFLKDFEVLDLKEFSKILKNHERSIAKIAEVESTKFNNIEYLLSEYENYKENIKLVDASVKELTKFKQSLLNVQELIKNKDKFKNELTVVNEELSKAEIRKNKVNFVFGLMEKYQQANKNIKKKESELLSNVASSENLTASSLNDGIEIASKTAALQSIQNDIVKQSILYDEVLKNREFIDDYDEERRRNEAFLAAGDAALKNLVKSATGVDAIIELCEANSQSFLEKIKRIIEAEEQGDQSAKAHFAESLRQMLKAALVENSKLRDAKKDKLISLASKERELQSYNTALGAKKKLLSDSLHLIDRSAAKCDCPVCKTSFLTAELVKLLETEIGATDSIKIQEISGEVAFIKKEIASIEVELLKSEESAKALVAEAHRVLKKIAEGFSEESDLMGDKLGDLSAYLDAQNEKYSSLMSRLKILLEEEFEEYEEIEKALAVHISKTKELETTVRKELEGLQRRLGEVQAQVAQFKEMNVVLEEDIKRLKDDDYNEVTQFLIENGIDGSSPKSADKIAKILGKEIEAVEKFEAEITNLKSLTVVNQKELDGLPKEATEKAIFKQIDTLESEIAELKESIVSVEEVLSEVGLNDKEYKPQVLKKIATASKKVIDVSEVQMNFIEDLEGKIEEFKSFNGDKVNRKKVENFEKKIKDFEDELTNLAKIKEGAVKLRNEVPEALRDLLHENLDEDLFNEIYGALSPHRKFKHIEFDIDVQRSNLGIRFEAKHSKMRGRPEFLFSSGQLNTFGVCMFLSMALRQNWLNLDTILIDDPIQNLDDINVLSFIDFIRGLLDSEVRKKQIILSTHDERFYDLMRKKFQNYDLKAFKFESYGKVMQD